MTLGDSCEPGLCFLCTSRAQTAACLVALLCVDQVFVLEHEAQSGLNLLHCARVQVLQQLLVALLRVVWLSSVAEHDLLGLEQQNLAQDGHLYRAICLFGSRLLVDDFNALQVRDPVLTQSLVDGPLGLRNCQRFRIDTGQNRRACYQHFTRLLLPSIFRIPRTDLL